VPGAPSSLPRSLVPGVECLHLDLILGTECDHRAIPSAGAWPSNGLHTQKPYLVVGPSPPCPPVLNSGTTDSQCAGYCVVEFDSRCMSEYQPVESRIIFNPSLRNYLVATASFHTLSWNRNLATPCYTTPSALVLFDYRLYAHTLKIHGHRDHRT